MNDMSATIIAKSDQINAADIIGTPITMTVREVQIKAAGSDDQPVSIFFEGEKKAFRPCKGVRRLLVHAWGVDANRYIGRSLTLFCDPSVTWAGKEEGGIRVSHMSDIEGEFVFSMRTSRTATKQYRIKPLVVQRQARPAEDHARKWAAGYIAKVNAAQDRVELEQHIEQRAPKLAELKTARPELHQDCVDAIEAKRDEFDNPTAQEGPADSQRVEGFVEDEA